MGGSMSESAGKGTLCGGPLRLVTWHRGDCGAGGDRTRARTRARARARAREAASVDVGGGRFTPSTLSGVLLAAFESGAGAAPALTHTSIK